MMTKLSKAPFTLEATFVAACHQEMNEKMNEKWMRKKNNYSFAYVYLQLRGEQSHKLYHFLSYWLSLPKFALHLHKVVGFCTLGCCWTRPIRSLSLVSPEIASYPLKWMGLCHYLSLVVWMWRVNDEIFGLCNLKQNKWLHRIVLYRHTLFIWVIWVILSYSIDLTNLILKCLLVYLFLQPVRWWISFSFITLDVKQIKVSAIKRECFLIAGPGG